MTRWLLPSIEVRDQTILEVAPDLAPHLQLDTEKLDGTPVRLIAAEAGPGPWFAVYDGRLLQAKTRAEVVALLELEASDGWRPVQHVPRSQR